MATIIGSAIVSRARILLNDVSAVRWPDTEMLLWVNSGRREMASLKPEIFGATADFQHTTTAGPSQRCASPDVHRVTSVDSDSTGRALRPTTRAALDSFRPGWRSDVSAYAQNWFPDDSDPLRFWIYPSVGTGKTLNLHVLASPSDLTALTQVALPFDIYESILVNYLCYRAFAKETEAGSVEKAVAYFKLFSDALA